MGEAFLYALILGIAFGVFYDILRFFRLVFNSDFILDLFFWIVCALAAFLYLIVFDNGNVRAYYFIIMLSGFLIYIWSIGSFTVKAQRYITVKIKIRLKKVKNRLKSLKKVLQYVTVLYYNIKVKFSIRKKADLGDGNEKEYENKEK